ncbi:MAG: zinc-ribbon domain-containing protein [Acidobacteriota bacterium]
MVVRCPGCNTQYSLDERGMKGGEFELTCSECGTKWTVGHHQERGSSPPATAQPAVPPRRPPSTDPAAVACPQCGHRFVPSSATVAGRNANNAGVHHILLVEDQGYFVQLVRDALGQGFQTMVVNDLDRARAALKKHRFDLVILDLSLKAGQDGTRLLRVTKRAGLPVLIFTARDETDLYGDAWESLRAEGASDILIKGLHVTEDLRKKVLSLLRPATGEAATLDR